MVALLLLFVGPWPERARVRPRRRGAGEVDPAQRPARRPGLGVAGPSLIDPDLPSLRTFVSGVRSTLWPEFDNAEQHSGQ
jgi:hypothetical protein